MLVKTHLIVKDQYDEYEVKWVKPLIKTNPQFDSNGNLQFAVISNKGRLEVNTFNLMQLEKSAKNFTFPKGRQSVTKDKGYIYLKEKEGESLVAVVIHTHIRKYAPMYDDIDI